MTCETLQTNLQQRLEGLNGVFSIPLVSFGVHDLVQVPHQVLSVPNLPMPFEHVLCNQKKLQFSCI